MSENRQTVAGAVRPLETLLEDLESLTADLVASVGPDALAADPACAAPAGVAALVDASARLRMVGHRLDVLRTTFLPVIDEAGLWALTGARTFATWLAATEQIGRKAARREVRTATVLRDVLPTARKAALDGRIGPDHLRALVDVAPTSQARKEALAAPAIDGPFERPDGPETRSHDTSGAQAADGDVGSIGESGSIRDAGSVNDAGSVEDAGSVVEGPRYVDPGRAGLDTGFDGEVGSGAVPGRAAGGAPVPTWEDQLLEWAGDRQVEDFRGMVRYFAKCADPEADERGLRKAQDKEYLNVSPTMDGYHVAGFLTPEHGQLVTTALDSIMGAPAAADDRTPGQRRAQGLADLARTVLDNGRTGTGAAVRPHLNVTVSWTELRGLTHYTDLTRYTDQTPEGDPNPVLFGPLPPVSRVPTAPATTTGPTSPPGLHAARPKEQAVTPAVITGTGIPVPGSLLRRITCDCEVTRIVFGPDGAVLDVGRAQRTVTGPMRRAVIARDRHCVWPGCDQPPGRCEVHHAVRHWADGGHTSADNAALLCWHHHDRVDGQHITMRWTGNPNGTHHSGWTLTDRNGHQITSAGEPTRLPDRNGSLRETRGERRELATRAASHSAQPPETATYRPLTQGGSHEQEGPQVESHEQERLQLGSREQEPPIAQEPHEQEPTGQGPTEQQPPTDGAWRSTAPDRTTFEIRRHPAAPRARAA